MKKDKIIDLLVESLTLTNRVLELLAATLGEKSEAVKTLEKLAFSNATLLAWIKEMPHVE